jgi:hypothetical protein
MREVVETGLEVVELDGGGETDEPGGARGVMGLMAA